MGYPAKPPAEGSIASWALLALIATGCWAGAATAHAVDFDREVRPIFVQHCVACHGGVKQAGGLSLVRGDSALAATDSGEPSIRPGDAEASYLIARVADPDDDSRMPPPEHGPRLSATEVDTLRRWIEGGAVWTEPWVYLPPESSEPPADRRGWARASLDRFIFKRLDAEGLAPANEASREAWLRRVSFDLIGLPPSDGIRQAFLADESSEAYERVVDALLASPHFGERWATVWLDLVRYADTMGYERDRHRDIWPYRDWVIRAFDDDKPYDRFVLEQLAGDLLPDATLADRLATAMHRNTPTNIEGGTDDEEFRVEAVVDRVDTTWQAIGGLTFGCARCHDHPYEPITHVDYYRFLACFNSTQDADLAEEYPRLAAPNDPTRWDDADRIDRRLRSIDGQLHGLGAGLADDFGQWRGVAFEDAESTGETELTIRPLAAADNVVAAGAEVSAGGTITDRSVYTIAGPAPAGPMTALRIDALPGDPVEALRHPEMGFVLARLRAFVERDGTEREVFFQHAFCDDPAPLLDPEQTLADSADGWASYSRMLRPHWLVLTVDEAIDGSLEFLPGDRLRIELKHDKPLDGQDAIVLRRFRVAVSGDERWRGLASDDRFRRLRDERSALRRARREIPATPTPVMAERPDGHERPTHRFERGNRLVKAELVEPGLPSVFGASEQSRDEPPRLRMARWFASKHNPLAARVWANRVWAELFGAGLSPTLDNLGVTGERPSHPGLLDHLAARLVDEWGWRLKPMLREVVLSATYRQDSRADAEALRRDPDNRLLARGPRARLTAEMIRDQALALSGRLNPERFGPPVMPYQPNGVWRSVYNDQRWETATDDNRFRRAIYTYRKKTAAYPSLIAFDAPSRERCVARRPKTNTPLQALVTMNDPAFFELAEGFADRALARPGTKSERIAWAYGEATGAAPSDGALAALVELYDSALESSADLDTTRLAMTIVANALLNLDATLCK